MKDGETLEQWGIRLERELAEMKKKPRRKKEPKPVPAKVENAHAHYPTERSKQYMAFVLGSIAEIGKAKDDD